MKQLISLFTALTCGVCMADMLYGSGDGSGVANVDQIDPDFCIKLFGVSPTQFFIYWLRPDTISDVSYYQVFYNVSVYYQTVAGERIFTDSHTTDPLAGNSSTLAIPLYNANCTYVIQITAVTDDGEIINSNYRTITEDEFEDVRQNAHVIRFFQLGLELNNTQATFDCLSFENDYDNILFLIQIQLSQAVYSVCTSAHDVNVSGTCATQFANDHFSCHNNSRIVYVARVIATMQTNTTAFLEYLKMLSPLGISLHNRTFSIISSPLCPLSIPSPEESNCSWSLTTTNATTTNATRTVNSSEPNNDMVMVTVVALSCLVGIILMTLCLVGVMYVCSRCSHYHGDVESIELDDEEHPYTAKISSNSQMEGENNLNLQELYNPPDARNAQQFKFSSVTVHMEPLPSSHSNGHHGNQSTNNLFTTSV